jgi:tripartite-type tricarboxylate transporter receptor subunit TctC
VHPDVPASSVKELVALARAKPGTLNFASPGNGSQAHVAVELLKLQLGLDLVHVPYQGVGPAVKDLLGGRINVMVAQVPSALPHIKAGKLRALGVLEGKRAKAAPEIPTVGEAVGGYAIPDTWAGILGPAGLPAPIVAKLSAELSAAVASPDVRARLDGAGFEFVGSSPKEFGDLLSGSVDSYRKIVNQAGIRPE